VEPVPFDASDGARIALYRSLPEGAPRATVHVAHGMGEHARRYAPLAGMLAAHGYAVYAGDHRGHGATAEPEGLGWLGPDGWNRVIRDTAEIGDRIQAAHPGVPRVLIGHSMGAMLAQQFVCTFGDRLDALVLSGSPGFPSGFRQMLSTAVARFERWRLGPASASALLERMIFGRANDAFAHPGATGFEWLSRDPAQVQAYVDDPLCGFVLRAGSLYELFRGAREASRPRSIARIPAGLPVLVLSGSADPVHAGERNLRRLRDRYARRVERLDYRIYSEGRHELFNEINRDSIVQDLLDWLEATLGAAMTRS
jgi:alpha-beta hydrolase superfamily lysophospholipase